MARASIHIMNLSKDIYEQNTRPMCSHINVGAGSDLSIEELANIIKKIVGYKGEIRFDSSKPDGTIRKFLDSQLINNLGWAPKVSLVDGLTRTYEDFIKLK